MMDFATTLALVSPKTGEEMSIASLAIPADDPLYSILTVISGLFWTIAYIWIIYRGFKDKTCGMPLLVLGLNWAWEFIFAFMGTPLFEESSVLCLSHQTPIQRMWDVSWFCFDCVILFLKFKYGKDEYEKSLPGAPSWMRIPFMLLVIAISTACVMFSVHEWNDYQGAYAAYIQNIFISSLFIQMLFRKGCADGQSMGIAIFKCLGTVAPSLMGALVMIREYGCDWAIFVDFTFMPLMKFLIECCLLFDIIYIVTLYRVMKYHDHVSPWTRRPLKPSEYNKKLRLPVMAADAPTIEELHPERFEKVETPSSVEDEKEEEEDLI